MTIYEFEKKRPAIGEGTFVFESADVIGEVTIGENCFIGAGARIRGDYGSVVIGDNTAVEENVVIHARPDDVTRIGNDVTVGHGSVVHNAVIEDMAIIGMGAVVSDWAHIGRWAVIAEGSVVKNKQEVAGRTIVAGVPARVVGRVSEEYVRKWGEYKKIYGELASERYPETLKRIEQQR